MSNKEDICEYLIGASRSSQFRCKITRRDLVKVGVKDARVATLIAEYGLWAWTAPFVGFEDSPWVRNELGWIVVAGWDDVRNLCVKGDGGCIAYNSEMGQSLWMADRFLDLLWIFSMYEKYLSCVHEEVSAGSRLSPHSVSSCHRFLECVVKIGQDLSGVESFWHKQLNWLMSESRGKWFWSS